MAARIVFVGRDTCHRLPVLVQAGYQVKNFESLGSFRDTRQPGADADAILLTDLDAGSAESALAVARAHGSAPVILFRDHNWDYEFRNFDMVVPPLTGPRKWLEQMEFLIRQSRAKRRLSRGGRLQCETLSAPQNGLGQGTA